ncbi:MAG: hypothetical protein ACRC4W_08020, partial [Treponemataceae bacterium]
MKKSLVLGIVLLCMSFSTFAIDFSVGGTLLGIGPSFSRSKSFKTTEDNTAFDKSFSSIVFAPVISVNTLAEFIPYFGTEIGLGFGTSKSGRQDILGVTNKTYSFDELVIPVFLRGQLPFGKGSIAYLGLGFNVGITLAVTERNEDKTNGSGSKAERDSRKLAKNEYSSFSTALMFALGCEFKAAEKHFFGVRMQYNLGIIGKEIYP